MTRNKRIGLALLVLAVALAAGCSKPAEGYALVSRQAAEADGGRFAFDVDLDDSTAVYATFVAARINTARLSDTPLAGNAVELQMSVTSPSGETAIERIAFPLQASGGQILSSRHSGRVRDYLWPWRENIRVSGSGVGRWKVVITLPDPAAWNAVEGVGLSYKGLLWEKAN